MDYRNADGSLAEMCGNGTRVFASCLVREGLARGERFDIATRAGVKHVRVVPEGFAVDLGPWRYGDEHGARRDGFDIMVRPRHGKPVRLSPSISATRTPSSCSPRPSSWRISTSRRRRSSAGAGQQDQRRVRQGGWPLAHRDACPRAWGRRDQVLWHGSAAAALATASGPVKRTSRRGRSTYPAARSPSRRSRATGVELVAPAVLVADGEVGL